MAKKKKRLTVREKEERKQIKKQLQEQGVLPPDKPRLNRKKFAQEVCKEWEEQGDYLALEYSLMQVLSMMTNSGKYGNVSSEDLGILKLKKCTLELQKALDEKRKMTYKEVVDLLMPIWQL